MKSQVFFRCICGLGMLRGVTLSSSPHISDSDSISIDISTNNRYYEYNEGELMSFKCAMLGSNDRKANITFAIDGDQKKELFGVRQVTIERVAKATDNGRDLRYEMRFEGAPGPYIVTHLITVSYSPRVAAEDLVNGTYIATDDFKVGQGATLKVRFRANPRPYQAEFKVNGKELDAKRFKPLTTSNFSTDNVSDSHEAALWIEKIEESDFEDEFQLHVTNEYGSTTIFIRMKNGNGDARTSWLHIPVLLVIAVGLSIFAYIVWRRRRHSTSKDNSVEDNQIIHQSTTATAKFYIPQCVKNEEQIFQGCCDITNEVSSSKIETAIIEGASGMGETRTSRDNYTTMQGDEIIRVEDNRMIHQSATIASTKFYIPQFVRNQEKMFESCYDLANEVSSSKTTITIVEGASGMGKTKCLEEIRDHFIRKKPEWRVVNLNMRIFRDDFASNLSSTSEAVTLVASKLQQSNEEQQVFENKAREGLMLYLFDDIDSIDNMKLEAVLEFFQLLQNVIATTRKPFTVKQPNLEKYSLQPLGNHQQGKFMKKLGCTRSIKHDLKTVKRDFDLGVPLYLLMTAQNALLVDTELPKEYFLTDIYKRFFENVVEKVLSEKKEFHRKSEMEVILHNLAILSAFNVYEQSEQEDERSIRDLALTCVINKRTHFTNTSIAEYLTASAMVKKLNNLPESANILLPMRFLSKLLVSDDCSPARHFVNNIISHSQPQSSTVHVECSNFLKDLVCNKSELALTIIKERLFSLSKELARNGLRLDYDQRLQLGKGEEMIPVIWAAMEEANDSEISSSSSELFRFLTESGASLDSVENGETALSIAIKASNEPLVKFLLELGATMKLVHNCCLHLAAETGNLPLVEFFSSHYEVDVVNSEGVTPLMLAAFEGNLQVVQFLISKGSNVNLQAANGSTSLHYAAQGGQIEVLKLLVAKENIDILNRNRETPLMFSLKEKQLEAVKYLLSAGADATKVDKKQNSCLHMAAENGWLDFVRLLAEGEKIKTLLNLPNRDGRIALHLAALIGHAETVRYLLDKGADPDKKDKDGNTPYMLATARGHTNIAKIIPVKNDDNKGKSSLLGKR